MEPLGFLCLVVVGLMALGGAVAVVFELIGDLFEAVLDLLGPIGAFLICLVLIGLCCGGVSSVL